MAGADGNADEDGFIARLGRLQGRGELEAVARHHAIVRVGGRHQRGRIAGPRLDVVVRRVPKRARNSSGLSDEP